MAEGDRVAMECSTAPTQPASSDRSSDTLDTFDSLEVGTSRSGDASSSLEDYVVEGKIGSGKFSTVYIARHLKSGRSVALKKIQLFDMMDATARRNCLNEVNTLKCLDHVNIIKYLEAFMQDNELVIVLEWADQGDLSKLLEERRAEEKKFSEVEIWAIFTQVCSGLKHMHGGRIMHRDLKPSNVFLSSGGVLKLGDLGLSRYFSSKTLQVNSVVGTPFYMPPECIKEQPYDWSSDVWSLGCLLYELITLRSPFYREGSNFYLLGKQITSCDYDPLPAGTPAEMVKLVCDMLRSNPKERLSIDQICEQALRCRERAEARVK